MQHDQESRTVSLFFYDPDLLSSYERTYVPHQALITSSSRKPSLEVGMLWVFLETFLIVNLLDEIPINYTMIQDIGRQHWLFWEKKEAENSGSDEPL